MDRFPQKIPQEFTPIQKISMVEIAEIIGYPPKNFDQKVLFGCSVTMVESFDGPPKILQSFVFFIIFFFQHGQGKNKKNRKKEKKENCNGSFCCFNTRNYFM
jgi:hypothetical protein